jgi:hypothetical protein
MHATAALTRSASAASLGSLAGPSGMGTKTMYKIPTTKAPANVVKNAVAILSFMVAPRQRCHYAIQRQFCAFLRAPVRLGANMLARLP